jgi:long-chain acyl-CoA synthetase
LNFVRLLRAVARRHAGRDAVVMHGHTETYQAFWEAISAKAGVLRGLGIARGDRVLLVLPNGHDFLHFHFAALMIGAVSVPVRTDYTGWEVRRIAANCRPSLVVSSRDWLVRHQDAMCLPTGICARTADSLAGTGVADDVEAIEPVGSGDAASINYSYFGGGYPKGATLTHANHVYAANGYARHQRFSCADRILIMLPMCHVYALSGCVNAGLVRGAALVPTIQHMPGRILQEVERHRVTVLTSVPSMFEMIAGYRRRQRYDLSSLRLLVTGGAFMPAARHREFEAAIGVEMVQGYGLTECMPVICNPAGPGNRPGTLGIPGRRDIWIRIVSADGSVLPPGQPGEIQIRSKTTMAGYFGLPEEDRRHIMAGDWLRTGDIGTLDADGYLYFHGMSKPIVNIHGSKADPEEIRQVFLEHPAVLAVEVTAGPVQPDGNALGEVAISARVSVRPGSSVSAAALTAFCRERLASYKVPRTVTVVEYGEAAHQAAEFASS